jgi:hypothetical protein
VKQENGKGGRGAGLEHARNVTPHVRGGAQVGGGQGESERGKLSSGVLTMEF